MQHISARILLVRAMTTRSDQFQFFGFTFSDLTYPGAMKLLDKMIASPDTSSLCFPNANTLNIATHNEKLRRALHKMDVLFGDGVGIQIASLMRGRKLKSNLNGTDLMPHYLAQRPGIKVFLLGSTPESIETVTSGFSEKFPQAKLVGAHHGFFDKEKCNEIIAAINKTKPDLLLVGMGNPIQEIWIAHHQDKLDAGLCIGVGGLFSYWEDALVRAPTWMRKVGLEWLGIMIRQPWKSARYLIGNPLFLLRAIANIPGDLWGANSHPAREKHS